MEKWDVNFGCEAKSVDVTPIKEDAVPVKLFLDNSIQFALGRTYVGNWGYGQEFNSNLIAAISKYQRGDKWLDVGPGNQSPYSSILYYYNQHRLDVFDIRKPSEIGDEFNFVSKLEVGVYDLALAVSVFEHCGLGRYGGALDPDGDIKLAQTVIDALKPGGILIFAVPVGPPAIVSNWHRIYNDYRLNKLTEGCEKLEEFGERMKRIEKKVKQPVIVCHKK